jgi:hypothetical protein
MKMLKRGLAGLLVLTSLGLNLPKGALCEDSLLFSKADKKTITRHEPKIMTTPAKDIPMVLAKKKQKGKMRYLWYGLGAAVVLGVVAAGGGGGGGGDTPGENTGNIAVGW